MAREDLYQQLYRAGKLHGTIKAARAKCRKRAALKMPPPLDLKARLIRARITVPVSNGDGVEAARKAHPQRKNWYSSRAVRTRIRGGRRVETVNEGRYSSRCKYTRYSYHVEVTSYVFPWTADAIRFVYADTKPKTIRAPHGYYWDRDANGLRLVAKANHRDDFHPMALDLLCGARHMVGRLKANAAKRRETAKLVAVAAREARHAAELVRRAEREGLHVCLADSLRAGNCRAGTETWGRRHGFDPTRHYLPSEVLASANGDTHRVALVVAVAMRRHRLEMGRGFAIIEEHRV